MVRYLQGQRVRRFFAVTQGTYCPYGNEDELWGDLSSDCAMCGPVEMRALMSTAALFGWAIQKIDVKPLFLQTRQVQRDVHVIPPGESGDRGKDFWLLRTAAYGLVNSTTKWKHRRDAIQTNIGITNAPPFLPQIILMRQDDPVVAMSAKIVEYILICEEEHRVPLILEAKDCRFKLNTIMHGPGVLRYCGINVVQHEDMSMEVDGDDKLSSISPMQTSPHCRRQLHSPITHVESRSFAPVNSAVHWLAITDSHLCAEFASRSQKLAPAAAVRDYCAQPSGVKKLQELGTL